MVVGIEIEAGDLLVREAASSVSAAKASCAVRPAITRRVLTIMAREDY
jgi:hypothetical protein